MTLQFCIYFAKKQKQPKVLDRGKRGLSTTTFTSQFINGILVSEVSLFTIQKCLGYKCITKIISKTKRLGSSIVKSIFNVVFVNNLKNTFLYRE